MQTGISRIYFRDCSFQIIPIPKMARKLILTFLSIIFSLVFTIWITAFNLKYYFLNADFYKNLLNKSGIYNLISQTVPTLTLEGQEYSIENIPIRFTEQELLSIYSKIITREYVQVQMEKTIDSFFNSLNNQEKLEISISLMEPKENLQKEMQVLMQKKLQKLPICTESELQKISSSENVEIPLCLPGGLLTNLNTFISDSVFMSLNNEIPEVISLYGGNTADFDEKFVSLSLMLKLITHEIYYLSLIFSVLLMTVIFIIAKPTSTKFSLVGWNLLNIALFPFIFSLFGFFAGNQFISTILNSYGSSLPQKTIYDLLPAFQSLFHQLWLLIFTETLFILVPGVILIVIAKIYKNIERSEKERVLIQKVEEEERVTSNKSHK